MITAALRRLLLLPAVLAMLIAGAAFVPATAWATGSDDVTMIQEYGTHYVGGVSDVSLIVEDDSTSCFAFGDCDTPTGSVTMTLTYPGTGIVAAVASGPVTPESGSNMTSLADIAWYVGANAGTYDASYAYSGDGQFAPATVTGSITSSTIPTSVTLTADSYQTYAGQPVTFTAHVTATQDDPYQIGGTAQLWYGVNPWSSPFNVVNGVGTLTTASLPASDNTGRTYFVKYLGDGQHDSSESNNVDHRTLPTTATSVALAVPGPDWLTDPVTMSIHVSAADGTTQPGAVTFLAWQALPYGGQYLAYSSSGIVAADGTARASWPPGELSIGSYTVQAAYGPASPAYAASTASAPLTIVAPGSAQPGATVTVTATPNPGTVGGSTTLTASVAVPASPAATGSVRFVLDGTTTLGTCALAASTCAITTATPAQGSHSIRARYLGDAHWQPAIADTTLAVRAKAVGNIGANPRRAQAGTKVTIHTRLANPDGTPARGRVSFRQGGGLIGAAKLDATGLARITCTELPVGTDTVLAQYSGSALTAPRTLTITITITPA